MNKLFWADSYQQKYFHDLFHDLNKIKKGQKYIWERSAYNVFLKIIHSLLYDYPIILLDGDISEVEIKSYGHFPEEMTEHVVINRTQIHSFEELKEKLDQLVNWKITLLTSGTTGIPKEIQHNFTSITKAVKTGDEHQEDIWGFAYNPTHMAGIQVFFQALLNKNTMINLFEMKPAEISEIILKFGVTHISATPTFYRLFIENKITFPKVKLISSGGEKFSNDIVNKLNNNFPNARIRNIYASTEAGSLFASEDEYFSIPQKYKEKIKIIENEILIHRSILGESENLQLIDDWYHSGDLVEIINEKPKTIFRFVSRKNKMINIGGYKINPEEVEDALLQNPKIISARVYGKKNAVLGNILCADVISKDISEKEIRQKLSLQSYKIPRIINFVDNIDLTRTGKVKR